jgi:hypothetical protein
MLSVYPLLVVCLVFLMTRGHQRLDKIVSGLATDAVRFDCPYAFLTRHETTMSLPYRETPELQRKEERIRLRVEIATAVTGAGVKTMAHLLRETVRD